MNRRHFVLFAVLALLAGAVWKGEHLLALGWWTGTPEVAVAYDPAEVAARPDLRDAWEASLTSHGIRHVWLAENDLALLGADSMLRRYPAVVVPDGLARWVSDGLAGELREYANRGGIMLVGADAASRTDDGHVFDQSVLATLVGLHNVIFVPEEVASLAVNGQPEPLAQAVARTVTVIAASGESQLEVGGSR